MMQTHNGYFAKVPGAPGHLCMRCAMTRESRAQYARNCPLPPSVADLCPYLTPAEAARLHAIAPAIKDAPGATP